MTEERLEVERPPLPRRRLGPHLLPSDDIQKFNIWLGHDTSAKEKTSPPSSSSLAPSSSSCFKSALPLPSRRKAAGTMSRRKGVIENRLLRHKCIFNAWFLLLPGRTRRKGGTGSHQSLHLQLIVHLKHPGSRSLSMVEHCFNTTVSCCFSTPLNWLLESLPVYLPCKNSPGQGDDFPGWLPSEGESKQIGNFSNQYIPRKNVFKMNGRMVNWQLWGPAWVRCAYFLPVVHP